MGKHTAAVAGAIFIAHLAVAVNSHATAPVISPFGSWATPLSAEALAAGDIRFADLRAVDGTLYWTENDPAAGGNIVLYRTKGGAEATALTPQSANVRTRVHEMGGAPYVTAGDTVYYSEFSDQRLYATNSRRESTPLTPAGYRYGDCKPMPSADGSIAALICVREDHTDSANVRNTLVRLPVPAGGAGEVLYSGSDFVAYPRISPDGRELAFISWNHPNMPWDATTLKVAKITPQGLKDPVTVAGGPSESVLEPQWDSDGTLYFISDRSDYWNLYARRADGVHAVWPRAADFAQPLWSLGQANYVLLGDGRGVARFGERGIDQLAVIDLKRGTARVLDLPYVEFSELTRIDSHTIAAITGSTDQAAAIVRIDIADGKATKLRSGGALPLTPADVSTATPIEFPSAHGRTAYAFYYAPRNSGYKGPAGARPPLVTLVHGGPTAQASPARHATVQFWTARGFAVVDVNYGGSSGYGRKYRQSLKGNWGVVDAEDVIAAVRYLVSTQRADSNRVAISGGSAGGYTVLVALSSSDVFRAGADYFGISDMTALARDTHKFESRYIDSLIGPLPQAQSIYDERSPLNHLDGFKAPLIIFQGAEDPIVPPNQSALIATALRARKVPLAYILYPGEGHGFRKPEHIINSLQSELSFYGQVFGFTPADHLPKLKIEGLLPPT